MQSTAVLSKAKHFFNHSGEATMKLQLYKFTGLTPLLMSSIKSIEEIAKQKIPPPKLGTAPNKGDYEKIAAAMAYKNKDGTYYMPAQAFRTSLLTGCVGQKMPGTRQGPANMFKGLIFAAEEQAALTDFNGDPITSHEMQIDSGVNGTGKNKKRIIVIRARVDEWQAVVPFEIDDEFAPVNFDEFMGLVLGIWNRAGRSAGVGAWRPECSGPFGRYSVEQV
jgi:hypothetical protein